MNAKRILLVVYSDSGHLNPMVAVAQQLERLGHEVTIFSCQEDVAARIGRAGLAARALSVTTNVSRPPKATARRSIQLAEWLANAAWMKRWLTATLVDPLADQVAALRRLVSEIRPDVIATDAMAYAGAVAAELEGVRWAALATGLQSLDVETAGTSATAFRAIGAARADRIAKIGAQLEFRSSDVVSPHANVLFASSTLLERGKIALPSDVRAVGAALPVAARGDEPAADFSDERVPTSRPVVYVAFGSHLSPPEHVYEAIAASLAPDEATIVMALKDLVAEPFARALPEHVVAVEYAPQLALLERASVMVNHGGANSVMECLARGTPMIALPLGYDQPVWAELVARAGVGRAMTATATKEEWREALVALMRPDAPERRVTIEGESDGASLAAEIVVSI